MDRCEAAVKGKRAKPQVHIFYLPVISTKTKLQNV